MDEVERKALEVVRVEFLTNESRLYEHTSRTFHWLLATLFAANGSGILGLLADRAHELPGRIPALGWFAFGLVFSLLMGVMSAFQSVRAATAFASMRLEMEESLIIGQSCQQKMTEFFSKMQPTWKTWLPSYAGAASLLLFITGLGTIAGSLIRAG